MRDPDKEREEYYRRMNQRMDSWDRMWKETNDYFVKIVLYVGGFCLFLLVIIAIMGSSGG